MEGGFGHPHVDRIYTLNTEIAAWMVRRFLLQGLPDAA